MKNIIEIKSGTSLFYIPYTKISHIESVVIYDTCSNSIDSHFKIHMDNGQIIKTYNDVLRIINDKINASKKLPKSNVIPPNKN